MKRYVFRVQQDVAVRANSLEEARQKALELLEDALLLELREEGPA